VTRQTSMMPPKPHQTHQPNNLRPHSTVHSNKHLFTKVHLILMPTQNSSVALAPHSWGCRPRSRGRCGSKNPAMRCRCTHALPIQTLAQHQLTQLCMPHNTALVQLQHSRSCLDLRELTPRVSCLSCALRLWLPSTTSVHAFLPYVPEKHSSCITPNPWTSKRLQLAATATAYSKN